MRQWSKKCWDGWLAFAEGCNLCVCPGKFFATINGVLDYLLFSAGYNYDPESIADEITFVVTELLTGVACQITCHDCLSVPPDNSFNLQSALPKVDPPQK